MLNSIPEVDETAVNDVVQSDHALGPYDSGSFKLSFAQRMWMDGCVKCNGTMLLNAVRSVCSKSCEIN